MPYKVNREKCLEYGGWANCKCEAECDNECPIPGCFSGAGDPEAAKIDQDQCLECGSCVSVCEGDAISEVD